MLRVRGGCQIVGPGLDLNGRPELTADRTKEAREVGVASLQSVTETDTGITDLCSIVLIEGWREEHLVLTLEHDTGGGRCDAQVTRSPHYSNDANRDLLAGRRLVQSLQYPLSARLVKGTQMNGAPDVEVLVDCGRRVHHHLIHLVGSRKTSGHDEGAAEVKVVEHSNGADLVRVINARLPIEGLKQHESARLGSRNLGQSGNGDKVARRSLDLTLGRTEVGDESTDRTVGSAGTRQRSQGDPARQGNDECHRKSGPKPTSQARPCERPDRRHDGY